MNIRKLYENTLIARYTHLEEETASFCKQRVSDTLYIYFEGSNGRTDWKNNFDFPVKPYRDMKDKWYAHRGFLRVWKAIETHLKESIMNPIVKRIIISGFSHGAAIALLCHEYCKFNRPDAAVFGYAFGCPRVAWGFLQKEVKRRFEDFTVIRNGRDIVTHVPPALFGFRHVGQMLQIGKGKYRQVESHYPENYLKELEEWCYYGIGELH